MPAPFGYLSTADSARLIGVQPGTIRKWRSLGYLAGQGLDDHGNPVHTAEAVRAAEQRVRESGLNSATGADPRRTRGRYKLPAMAATVTDEATARICHDTRHACPACPTSARELGTAAAEAHAAIMAAISGAGDFEQAMRKLAELRGALDTWEREAAAHETAMRAARKDGKAA